MSVTIYIGVPGASGVDYGAYIEFGTGKYSSLGGGTHKESWFYVDEFGVGHIAHPQKPRPYLKPAVADHTQEYLNLLKQSLENA